MLRSLEAVKGKWARSIMTAVSGTLRRTLPMRISKRSIALPHL